MGGQSFTITSIPVAAAGTIPPFQSNGNLTRSFNVSLGGTIVPISDSGSYHSIRIALSRRIYLRSERSGILVPVEGGKELKFMHVPYKRNPIRCQFTTVRGVTKTRGFLHPNQNVLNATQNSLSRAVNRVRGGKENPTANPGSIVPKIFPGLVPPALAFTPRGMFPKVRWMLSGL